jgi:hypothetical protein
MPLHAHPRSGTPPIGDGPAGAASAGSTMRSMADWLCLAAAPTFAIMALLTGVLGEGMQPMTCLEDSASPLGGMVPMYLLMSVFHSAPWLKWLSRRPTQS